MYDYLVVGVGLFGAIFAYEAKRPERRERWVSISGSDSMLFLIWLDGMAVISLLK